MSVSVALGTDADFQSSVRSKSWAYLLKLRKKVIRTDLDEVAVVEEDIAI